MKFHTGFTITALLFGAIIAEAGYAQEQIFTPTTQEFKKDGVLGADRNDLYLFCQDKARQTSGYLGYVPGEYTGPNLLEESFNRNRQGGLYDIPLSGFKGQPRKAGTIGGKIVFSFGNKLSSNTGKKKRQQRRDFRKNLDGCLLSKR